MAQKLVSRRFLHPSLFLLKQTHFQSPSQTLNHTISNNPPPIIAFSSPISPAATRSYARERRSDYNLFGNVKPGDNEFRKSWEKEMEEDRTLWTGSEDESDTEEKVV